MRFWTEAAAPSVEFQAELTSGPNPVVMLTDSSQHIEMMLTLDEVNSLLAALMPLAEQALHNQVAEALDEL